MLAVGKAIRTLRARKGVSQKELAERAEITPSFLSLVEGDRRDASIKVIERIASALDVSSEVLIWEAVELPADLSEKDRRMCELAKIIVRGVYENATRAADDPTPA
ncbi:MAG: helix-turn-helix transcriptional regulator [Phycisphaeraceae bacterium]|nr:helix-turn-helix transcriptional regulator [Phycisphaeraceae bacterium]MCW5764066.1 helix-turn-helix transcriptional regulator [Phycisphaeraceae bacterium]